ncbi:MAG: hypothetical protein KJ668_03725, partial [Proteobacteria bacterium]|nr:hypothetical protein [Pseudomonadota bacterium]
KGIKDGILPVELNDTFKYKKNADWEALESDLRKGWEHRAVMEEEGRWSWQRNLVQAYGYDLFKKEQVGGKKNEIDQRVVVQDKSNEKTPSKDRMRFSRWIFDDAMTEPQKKHLEKLKEFFPPWTMSGRKIWQTMLRDRISLLGDVYGLVRGATISGTTSDHAYSFFQICSSISTLSESSPEYRMLTISSDIKRQPGQWHIPSTDELTAALQNMRNEDGGDSGFGRMVRFMMLIPIIQMGIEMHHSLHEMASVIGLNDLINWSIGHYDTLYMTTKELKELEEKYLAQWNKSAKGSPGLLKSTPMKLPQNKLTNVETDIKKILQETTDKVSHGYFKTQDPFVLSKIEEENEVGACIAETREIAKHKEMALLDQDLIKKLNEAVKSGWVKGAEGEGIPTEFLNWHIRDLRYSINKNPAKMELVDNLKTALARSRKSAVTPISVDSIKEINGKIWDSYNAAWKSWQQIGKQNK